LELDPLGDVQSTVYFKPEIMDGALKNVTEEAADAVHHNDVERPIIVGSAFDHALELKALIVHRGSARLFKISNDLPALTLAIGRRRRLS
jgi:hypothetical protein